MILLQRATDVHWQQEREQERERSFRVAQEVVARYVGSLPRAVKDSEIEIQGLGPFWPLWPGSDGVVHAATYGLTTFDVLHGLLFTDSTIRPTTAPARGSDGTRYFGAREGEMLALDPGGLVRWTRTVCKGMETGNPAVATDGRSVYVACRPQPYATQAQPALVAVTSDGRTKWSIPIPWAAEEPPGIIGSNVYVVTRIRADKGIGRTALVAVGDDGGVKWTIDVPSAASSLVIGDTVFLISRSTLTAVTPDGRTRWSVPLHTVTLEKLGVTGDGTLWRTQSDGPISTRTIVALGPDGTTRWTYDPSPITGMGVERAGAGKGVTFVESNTVLFALDSEGRVAWTFDQSPGRVFLSLPVTVNDFVCVLTGYATDYHRSWLTVVRPPERRLPQR